MLQRSQNWSHLLQSKLVPNERSMKFRRQKENQMNVTRCSLFQCQYKDWESHWRKTFKLATVRDAGIIRRTHWSWIPTQCIPKTLCMKEQDYTKLT